jgi:hypothetical protein
MRLMANAAGTLRLMTGIGRSLWSPAFVGHENYRGSGSVPTDTHRPDRRGHEGTVVRVDHRRIDRDQLAHSSQQLRRLSIFQNGPAAHVDPDETGVD